jgi:uncharacterized protein YcnI
MTTSPTRLRCRASLLLAVALALVLPAAAAAHVELSPDRVAPGSFTLFNVLSPNESEQPLTGLRLLLPEGIEVDGVADSPGFTGRTVEDARHRVAALDWSGGSVAPDRLALFRFSASVGSKGTLRLTGIQRFADGSTRRWDTPVLTVAGDGSQRDGLTLALAAAALVVAITALVAGIVALVARRRAIA